jgi:hypothetical protein
VGLKHLDSPDPKVDSVAQAALASHPRVQREYLSIPSDRFIVCGISLGCANEAHAANRFRTRRADTVDCVGWID